MVSSASGHLGCFHVSGIVSNAVLTGCTNILFESLIQKDKCPPMFKVTLFNISLDMEATKVSINR